MKKAVLLFVLCLSFATTVKAQTWWYNTTVHENPLTF